MQALTQPKFPSPDVKTRIWVDAAKVGEPTITSKFIIFWSLSSETSFDEDKSLLTANVKDIINNFDHATNVLGDHVELLDRHSDNGVHNGEITGFRLDDRGTEGTFLQAQIYPASKNFRERFNAGEIRQFSPSIAFEHVHVHSGEILSPYIEELSYTGAAQQRNLGDPIAQNPGVTLSKEEENKMGLKSRRVNSSAKLSTEAEGTKPEGQGEEAAETKLSIEGIETMEQLEAFVDSRIAAAMPTEESDEDLSKEATSTEVADIEAGTAAELSKLRQQLNNSEDRAVIAELKAQGLDFSDEEAATIARLSRTDENAYKVVLGLCGCGGSKPAPKENARTPEIGSGSVAEDFGGVSASMSREIATKAVESGVTLGNGKLSSFLVENGQEEYFSSVRSILKKER